MGPSCLKWVSGPNKVGLHLKLRLALDRKIQTFIYLGEDRVEVATSPTWSQYAKCLPFEEKKKKIGPTC
jgi:hypothetical protein